MPVETDQENELFPQLATVRALFKEYKKKLGELKSAFPEDTLEYLRNVETKVLKQIEDFETERKKENFLIALEFEKFARVITELRHMIAALESPPFGFTTFVRFIRDEPMERPTEAEEKEASVSGVPLKPRTFPLIEVKNSGGEPFCVFYLSEKKPDARSLLYGKRLVTTNGGRGHVIEALDEYATLGVEATVVKILEESDHEGRRFLVSFHGGQAIQVAHALVGKIDLSTITLNSKVLVDPVTNTITEVLSRGEAEKHFITETPTLTFNDIGGLSDVKREIEEYLIYPVLYPEQYKTIGRDPPKGCVLVGPPGNGKTMLARAIANRMGALAKERHGAEARNNFVLINGPELSTMWVGKTEEKMRELVGEATKFASPTNPVIVVWDEADSFLRTRGSGRSSDAHDTYVAQFCTLADGFDKRPWVIHILLTNRYGMLDPAVVRPGRFDRKFTVGSPDYDAAVQIMKIYLKPVFGQISPKYDENLYTQKDRKGNPRVDPKTGKKLKHKFNRDPELVVEYLVRRAADRIYKDRRNHFMKIWFGNSEKPREFKYSDFCSGARIKNIIDRAKDFALKRDRQGDSVGLGVELADLYAAIESEFKEMESPSMRNELEHWLVTEGKHPGQPIREVEYVSKNGTMDGD